MGSRGLYDPGAYYGARTRTSSAWGTQSFCNRGDEACATPAKLETRVRTIPVRFKTDNQTAGGVAGPVNPASLPRVKLREVGRPAGGDRQLTGRRFVYSSTERTYS